MSECTCDFCTGKKDWNDNWCARCVAVQMPAPKWWENMDVCDECERIGRAESAGEPLFSDSDRSVLLAMIPRIEHPMNRSEEPGPSDEQTVELVEQAMSHRGPALDRAGVRAWVASLQSNDLDTKGKP